MQSISTSAPTVVDEGPDRLFVNGDIHTLDPQRPRVSVLAVRDGRICYAGDCADEARRRLGAGALRTDLEGRSVFPGLIDSHLHFLTQGQRLSEMDIYMRPKEEILAAVAHAAAITPPGKWILGRGWNNEVWPDKAWPCKEELDAVAPHAPVMLTRTDAHSIWVNSAALAAAGFDRNSESPPGGEIWRNEKGELSGILVDTAIFPVWGVIPPMTPEEKCQAWEKAQAELFSYGITGIGDAWQYAQDHEVLKTAYAAERLRIRCRGMLGGVNNVGQSVFEEGCAPVRGVYGARLSLDMFKLVLDGSLGSQSAWLTRDYAGQPGRRGEGRYTDEELLSLMLPPARQGFRICLHAIGDAAVEQALAAYAALAEACPENAAGHRIEHFQMASSQQIRRALALGVIPAMQTIHEAADKAMAETRLDAASLAVSYPWRGVLDAGGIIANGSDSPMEELSPYLGLHAAVTRTPFSGLGLPSQKGQSGQTGQTGSPGSAGPAAELAALRLSRKEALLSYTVWAAIAQGDEGQAGRLAPGMLADFVVPDRNILSCHEEELRETKTLMTALGGQIVFDAR